MTEPKALSFDNVPAVKPVQSKVATGPKPLSFESVKVPAEPPVKAPVAVAKSLSFDNVKLPVHKVPVPVATAHPAFALNAAQTLAPQAVATVKAKFPDLYNTQAQKLELQIRQLLPLTITGVMTWADSALQELATFTSKSAKLVRDISQTNTNAVIEHANKAIQEEPNFLVKWIAKDDVLKYKPRLAVVTSNVSRWIPEISQMMTGVKEQHERLVVRLASLTAVIDVVGTIADNDLATTCDGRRRLLQQAAMQGELSLAQLDQTRKLLIQMKTTVDQLVNVTIPAYENARATR